MVLEYFIRIPRLWNKLISSLNTQKDDFFMGDLPEDILIEILSRLPADRVLECRGVSKQWLALTSTPYFFELHLKRVTPTLFLQSDMHLFIHDEGARADHLKNLGANLLHFDAPCMPRLFASCNGLLLFCPMDPEGQCFVCNPLTWEKVNILFPVDQYLICGFFFHPPSKEYRILFVCKKGIGFEYFIYSLGSQLWRKVDEFSYRPGAFTIPTILNGALHWCDECLLRRNGFNPNNRDMMWYERSTPPCSNSIIIFDIDTEKCRSMPHPGTKCVYPSHPDTKILELRGKLAFCWVLSENVVVDVLEDYENWFWVTRYVVDLYLDEKLYPFKDRPYIRRDLSITLVAIQNDELLIDWHTKGVFRYNLRHNTVKQVNVIGMKTISIYSRFDMYRVVIPYNKTFVSPSGFMCQK